MNSSEPDPRHTLLRDYISQGYHQCVQLEVAPPWNGRDGKALKKLLDDNPSWTVDFVRKLIKNKFYSDEPVGPAWEWLPRLFRYAEGPLDRYGKLRNSATTGTR